VSAQVPTQPRAVAPAPDHVTDALARYATRGTLFSIQFSNYPTVPSWSVHRIVRHLREVREPSVR